MGSSDQATKLEGTKRCNTCGRPAEAPYRRIGNDGAIAEGCVDAVHGPHLRPGTRSFAWHYRNEAVICRGREAILGKRGDR